MKSHPTQSYSRERLVYRVRCYKCDWTGYRSGVARGLRPIDRLHPKPCPACGGGPVCGLSPKVERFR